MADTKLLQEFIERSDLSYTSIAKKLGITYVGLNNKLKGRYDFTLKEALALKEILDLTQDEWNQVFADVLK